MGLIEILWTVTGVLVPLLLGTAWAMLGLSPPEFLIARCCVVAAAAVFIGVSFIWTVMMGWPTPARIAIAVVLGAVSLVGFSEAFRFINNRESALIAKASVVIDKRAAKREQLQKFYIECGQLLNTPLKKPISDEDFKKYSDAADEWVNRTATWINNNLGEAATARFLDRSGAMSFSYSAAVNEQHNNIINALTAFRKNLSILIETNAWDKD
jgi:membrane protein implicated in regulation of membrane protease activity